MQPIHGDLHPRVAEQQGRTNHTPKHTVRNRRTDKVPFIAACSHLTRKNTRFRSPASFPTQVPCNSHAAITMRFAAAGTYSITLRFAPTRCRTPRENQSHVKTNGPQPPHRQGTLHRRLQPLYTEQHKVSFSGFLPNPSPMQQACSHYKAFCSSRYIFMQPLHCDLHPRVAEHQGRTNHASKRTVRNRRTDEVPFIAACSHFTRNNTRFRSPASFPKQTPCNRHAAITMRFAAAGTYSCSHYIAICIHALQNTKVEPITRQNERSGTAAQTSSHFAWKNTRFRSPASPPKQAPCNILAATTMRFAATHTHSCSHVIAICTHALQNTKGEPITRQSERSATAAQTRYLLHRRLQPLYTENLARFRVPASSPTQAACNIHATITMRFATSLGKHASLYAHGNKT